MLLTHESVSDLLYHVGVVEPSLVVLRHSLHPQARLALAVRQEVVESGPACTTQGHDIKDGVSLIITCNDLLARSIHTKWFECRQFFSILMPKNVVCFTKIEENYHFQFAAIYFQTICYTVRAVRLMVLQPKMT